MEYPTMVYKNNRNNNYIANCMTTNICGFGKTEEDAVNKLWDAILTTSRVDGNDPVKNWDEHNKNILEKRNKLNKFNLFY